MRKQSWCAAAWKWLAGAVVAILLVQTSVLAAAPSGDELWAKADERIEKYRRADATVLVVDAAGKPVPGAKIAVEQTRHAFLFGSNIFMWGRAADEKAEAAYRQRFAELLNYATLGFYWPSYEPEEGKPGHEYAERVARWCREHGVLAKGHPLAWNFADPRWLPDDAEAVRRLQLARIDDCVRRFAGLIDRWDVVNEATHFDRPDFLLRAPKTSALWQKFGRTEFTVECFQHARKANPKATLVVNDYRTDPPYEELIEKLLDGTGKRVYDVIGIQSHMHGGTWSNQRIWEVCDRFARFGVPLHFTETTILSGDRGPQRKRPWKTTLEGEKYQAQEVVRFYTMLFSHPAVEAITWWDFSDYHAWQGAPAGFLRADMSPKPAFDELKKLVKGKWWTQAALQTGPDGKASFRGTLGDYKLTVTAAGRRPAEVKAALSKKGPNRWTVALP